MSQRKNMPVVASGSVNKRYMAKPKLTVITKPISRWYDLLKFCQNIFLRLKKNNFRPKKYGGHFAVTRSIVEGMQKINADFNYNPSRIKDLSEVVFVPGGRQALKWALMMKQKGVIKKLVTGPNQVIYPREKKSLICSELIDLFLTNSQWIRDFYIEDAPMLKDHIGIWPAGVDTEFWKPNKQAGVERRVLIYAKRPIKKMLEACVKILKNNGFEAEVFLYGKYSLDDYIAALNSSGFLIHLVEQESQGISMLEAWSMDTPTLVWNPGYYHEINGVNYYSSSSPYLTEATGKFFRDIDQFEQVIRGGFNPHDFTPRKWVLENLSDEQSARWLLREIDNFFYKEKNN